MALGLALFLAQLFGPLAMAQEQVSPIGLSRLQGMGGAGVGLADDEQALFINPAGLSGLKTRRFRPLTLYLEGDVDIYNSYKESSDVFKDFEVSKLNELLGKNLYFRGSANTMIALPNFAISFLGDVQYSLVTRNQTNPEFRLGYQYTNGIQAGFSHAFKSSKKANEEIRVGFAGKMLFRRGGYNDLTTADLIAIDDGKQFVTDLAGPWARGFGFDIGSQYVRKVGRVSTASAGVSIRDIANTRFSSSKADEIPMNISLGVGWKSELDFLSLSAALDYQNLTAATDWTNRLHFGLEAATPIIRVFAGVNQLYFSYGVGVDLWLLRMSLVSYTTEQGTSFRQRPSERIAYQLELKLPL
jgi:hypothetical protein